ncbi:MAG TPA: VOC family protein [Aquihabitans sp.]|nr:VOC family protein [Aquihabitans sp.]
MAFFPYLNFGGNCREAFTRYQEVFGGELVLLPMSAIPDAPEGAIDPATADLIMHAALKFGDDLLMASDDGGGFSGVQGMYVNYSTPDIAEAERVWKALSADGEVEMPMESTFWSPAFGVCRDRFGTPWMISADPTDQS